MNSNILLAIGLSPVLAATCGAPTVSIVFAVVCVAIALGLLLLVWMGWVNRWRGWVRWLLGAAVVLALLAVSAVRDVVNAQAPSPLGQGDHHPLHHDFYRHWKQPGVWPRVSCCNARVTQQGVETGDCEPSESRFVGGRWYARLPHAGAFVEVPESKILREPNPTQDGTDGHLCWSPPSGVLCFVPPFGGG